MAHGEEFSNTILVTVDGTPLPDDIKPLLVNGFVDDSTNAPDMFVLRFSDDGGTVLAKAKFKIGAKVELSLQSTAPGGHTVLLKGEVTTLEVEVGEKGVHTVVRGLDASHRLFRGTRAEAYVNMTASDIVSKVAQRAGLQCQGRRDEDPARPHQPGRRQRLGLPASPGRRARSRAHPGGRQARVHRQDAGDGGSGRQHGVA